MGENLRKIGTTKRHPNRGKPSKIGPSRARIGNPGPGETRKSSAKNPYKQGLKNQKHGKHASWVGDGYLTVRGSEVLISLGFKIPEMQFLKAQKKAKNAFQNWPKK
jgi:restriction endonuclease S subunit